MAGRESTTGGRPAAGRPGFSFLVCPDPELARSRLSELLAEHDLPGVERRVWWGDEEPGGGFWSDLTVPSLMGSVRAVVVRRAEKLAAETWDKLSQTLRGFNAHVWPFLCLEGEWDRTGPKIPKWIARQKCYQAAQDRGWVWTSPGLTTRTMRGFVTAWASARGLDIPGEVLDALTGALPPQATAAGGELDKVELAALARAGGRAALSALDMRDLSVLAVQAEMQIFGLVDRVERGGDLELWRTVLDKGAEGEELLFPLLALIMRQARVYWCILHGEPTGLAPYLAERKEGTARRLGAAGVARLWDLAIEAELAVKSGQLRPDQALDRLITGACSLFSATSRG